MDRENRHMVFKHKDIEKYLNEASIQKTLLYLAYPLDNKAVRTGEELKANQLRDLRLSQFLGSSLS